MSLMNVPARDLTPSKRTPRSAFEAGFTLIELMVVVAIVGVLTMVAYPAYQAQIIKGNRAAAQTYLLDLAQMQQQLFNDARIYQGSVDGLDVEAPPKATQNYVVTFELSTTPSAYVLTATPRAGTIQADDGALTISNTGRKERAGNLGW